jgi:predicted Zn-dependent protease
MRRLSAVAVMVLAVLVAGCSCSDENENLIKGESLLKTGDANGAREYFRMAIAENPNDPNACLSLAKACEMLDEPFEAIYAYQMYLRCLPETADGRAEAESKLAELKIRAVKQVAPEEEPASSEEMEELRLRCEKAETGVRTSRQVLVNLQKQNRELQARIAKLEKRGSKR